MEQVTTPEQRLAAAIADLRHQRCDFVKQLEAGNPMVQPSIDFIDNMLAQWVPGYTPPKGKGCCCEDK